MLFGVDGGCFWLFSPRLSNVKEMMKNKCLPLRVLTSIVSVCATWLSLNVLNRSTKSEGNVHCSTELSNVAINYNCLKSLIRLELRMIYDTQIRDVFCIWVKTFEHQHLVYWFLWKFMKVHGLGELLRHLVIQNNHILRIMFLARHKDIFFLINVLWAGLVT